MKKVLFLMAFVLFFMVACDNNSGSSTKKLVVTRAIDPGVTRATYGEYVRVVAFDLQSKNIDHTLTQLALTLKGYGGTVPKDVDLLDLSLEISTGSGSPISLDRFKVLQLGKVTFTGFSHVIPKGETHRLLVRASIDMNATLGGYGLYLETGDISITNDSSTTLIQIEDSNSALDSRLEVKNGVRLTIEIDPTFGGSQGIAGAAPTKIFRMRFVVDNDSDAPLPQKVKIDRVRLTFEGDLEFSNLYLIGPQSSWDNPVASSQQLHVTTVIGGNPSDAADHVSIITTAQFDFSGDDAYIEYGTSKWYEGYAFVYAMCDNSHPTRTLRVGIECMGIPTADGHLMWWDNGDINENPEAKTFGRAEPSGSLYQNEISFTGGSYIP